MENRSNTSRSGSRRNTSEAPGTTHASQKRGSDHNPTTFVSSCYSHSFPPVEELRQLLDSGAASVEDVRDAVAELRRQVGVIGEETRLLVSFADTIKKPNPLGTNEHDDDAGDKAIGGLEESVMSEYDSDGSRQVRTSSSNPQHDAGGSFEPEHLMLIEDKAMLVGKEMDRLKDQEEKANRESEEIKDLLIATVEEASHRMKELKLEVIKFNREVIDEESEKASGNLLRLYLEKRGASQKNYLDKLLGQCHAVEEDISRAQQQLRTRRAAGEAFHAIDFEQLRIENQQFNERIEKKNQELVDLKGTSTRTVQMLNTLMDALNDMTSEQAQLKKEYKSRCDYLCRCSKEVGDVGKEAGRAENKHQALRAQHEAVKVPKIEEYIAQKAELFELEKACKNWQRKVEIAEGQRQVLRQQVRRMRKQRDAAITYSENKKKRLLENLGKCPTKLPPMNPVGAKPPPGASLPPGFAPMEEPVSSTKPEALNAGMKKNHASPVPTGTTTEAPVPVGGEAPDPSPPGTYTEPVGEKKG